MSETDKVWPPTKGVAQARPDAGRYYRAGLPSAEQVQAGAVKELGGGAFFQRYGHRNRRAQIVELRVGARGIIEEFRGDRWLWVTPDPEPQWRRCTPEGDPLPW